LREENESFRKDVEDLKQRINAKEKKNTDRQESDAAEK